VAPVGERYEPPPDRHHAVPAPPLEWREDADDELVARILSDLDAA
jgi:hypothetical protein